MSKVDPRKLSNVSDMTDYHRRLADLFPKVDEHTTLLLEVAKQEPAPKASRELDAGSRSSALSSPRRPRRPSSRSQAPSIMPLGAARSVTDIESGASQVWDPTLADGNSSDTEVIVEKVEQPGIDSLRGTFGAIGTIIRNRRRTALTEAHDRSHTRNRRGSEASGLASQSINEELQQPGEERDAEKLDLSRRYFESRTRKPSEPTASETLSVPPRDIYPQVTPPIPSSSSSVEQPAVRSSPESEKSRPLTSPPTRQAPTLHAHFDPNQQPPSSRIQTSPPPPPSNNTTSLRSRVDQSDQGLTSEKEGSFT